MLFCGIMADVWSELTKVKMMQGSGHNGLWMTFLVSTNGAQKSDFHWCMEKIVSHSQILFFNIAENLLYMLFKIMLSIKRIYSLAWQFHTAGWLKA